MHDVRAIRHDPAAFEAGWSARGVEAPVAEILALDEARRQAQTALQQAQARRKELSGLVGRARAAGESAEAFMAEVEGLKTSMTDYGEREAESARRLDE